MYESFGISPKLEKLAEEEINLDEKKSNSKFKDFKLLYKDTMMNDYKFMVKKDNVEFYDLFNYIINTNSYYNYILLMKIIPTNI